MRARLGGADTTNALRAGLSSYVPPWPPVRVPTRWFAGLSNLARTQTRSRPQPVIRSKTLDPAGQPPAQKVSQINIIQGQRPAVDEKRSIEREQPREPGLPGGVFISYRREDSAGFAGRIYDRLVRVLGSDKVFLDVQNITPGVDFIEVLSERVGRCDVLLAVIGQQWLTISNADKQRRIDDPDDFVRIEIEAALARGIRVIPVLVDGARMPKGEDLPDSLRKLSRRQGIEISLARFDSDVERLSRALVMLQEELSQRASTRSDPA
jgi:hypothetical protein